MSRNSTNYTPRGGKGTGRRMQASDAHLRPIIDWAALWSRLWLFLKRLVAEVWYLLSRTRPHGVARAYASTSSASKGIISAQLLRRWSLPLFKVAAVLVLFFYVMQRDIQFSIHMKAPLAQAASYSTPESNIATEAMGFVQSVAFGGKKKQRATGTPSDMAAPTVEDYIGRFAQVAQAEMKKFGIPASVKMAQAILESQAGQTMAAKVDKNHFGAPLAGQPFESAWRNWREHSLLIVHRHDQLLKHGRDFRAWARGLQQSNYSDNDNYANELIELIDRFHLEQLDDPTI